MSKAGLVTLGAAVLAAGIWAYIQTGPVPIQTEVAPTPTSAPSASAEQGAPTPTAAPTPTSAPSGSPGSANRPGSLTGRRARAVEPVASPSPTPTPVAPAPVVTPPQEPAKPVVPVSAPPEIVPESAPAAPIAPMPVFDAAAADVAPPRLLTPIANAPVRADPQYVPGSATIEVIVNPNGSVSSVKAAKLPETVAETLQMVNWLSITKSWRFTPAVRNGQPVRYRLLVPLSTLVAGRGIR